MLYDFKSICWVYKVTICFIIPGLFLGLFSVLVSATERTSSHFDLELTTYPVHGQFVVDYMRITCTIKINGQREDAEVSARDSGNGFT